jgi:hypothetical protein
MTKILQQAFELAKAWPDARQDELGELLLSAIQQDKSPLRLTDEQIAEVPRRRANPSPAATDGETEEFFKKFAG